MPLPTREEAYILLDEWVEGENLRRHMIAVEAAMRVEQEPAVFGALSQQSGRLVDVGLVAPVSAAVVEVAVVDVDEVSRDLGTMRAAPELFPVAQAAGAFVGRQVPDRQ